MDTWSLSDLDISPESMGWAGARSAVLSAVRRPARTAGQQVKDDGDGARVLADFLTAQRFI